MATLVFNISMNVIPSLYTFLVRRGFDSAYSSRCDPKGIIEETPPMDQDIRDERRATNNVFDLITQVQDSNRLQDNWNGYNSEKPNRFAREVAELILLETPSVRVPDRVAASAQGGIGIFFYSGDKYADIECFNAGEILGTTVIGDGDARIWVIKPGEIKNAIKEIGEFLAS